MAKTSQGAPTQGNVKRATLQGHQSALLRQGTSSVQFLPIPKRRRKIVNLINLRNGGARQTRDSPPGESQLSRLKASLRSKHPQMIRFGCF